MKMSSAAVMTATELGFPHYRLYSSMVFEKTEQWIHTYIFVSGHASRAKFK